MCVDAVNEMKRKKKRLQTLWSTGLSAICSRKKEKNGQAKKKNIVTKTRKGKKTKRIGKQCEK